MSYQLRRRAVDGVYRSDTPHPVLGKQEHRPMSGQLRPSSASLTTEYAGQQKTDRHNVRDLPHAKNTPQPSAQTRTYSYAKPSPGRKRRHMPQWLQLLLISQGALIIGFGSQIYAFGEVAIFCYGIAAWWWQIPSRTTFILATLSMLTTTALLVFKGNVGFAQHFATYTFLFMVVGVITLSRELKKEGGRIYSSRKNNN